MYDDSCAALQIHIRLYNSSCSQVIVCLLTVNTFHWREPYAYAFVGDFYSSDVNLGTVALQCLTQLQQPREWRSTCASFAGDAHCYMYIICYVCTLTCAVIITHVVQ